MEAGPHRRIDHVRENKDIETAYEIGINSYIVKPVDFLAFVEMVRAIKVYWLLTNQPPFPKEYAHTYQRRIRVLYAEVTFPMPT